LRCRLAASRSSSLAVREQGRQIEALPALALGPSTPQKEHRLCSMTLSGPEAFRRRSCRANSRAMTLLILATAVLRIRRAAPKLPEATAASNGARYACVRRYRNAASCLNLGGASPAATDSSRSPSRSRSSSASCDLTRRSGSSAMRCRSRWRPRHSTAGPPNTGDKLRSGARAVRRPRGHEAAP
jgi:hypothetical protein